MGRTCSCIASAQPAISSAVSPFARSATRKPAICAWVAPPLMISPITTRAASRVRSRPSRSCCMTSWIILCKQSLRVPGCFLPKVAQSGNEALDVRFVVVRADRDAQDPPPVVLVDRHLDSVLLDQAAPEREGIAAGELHSAHERRLYSAHGLQT